MPVHFLLPHTTRRKVGKCHHKFYHYVIGSDSVSGPGVRAADSHSSQPRGVRDAVCSGTIHFAWQGSLKTTKRRCSFPCCYSKLPQTWWLKHQKCILSQFWRPELWVNELEEPHVLGPKGAPFLAFFSFWWLLAFHDLWLHHSDLPLSSQSLPLPFPLCVCLWKLLLYDCIQGLPRINSFY